MTLHIGKCIIICASVTDYALNNEVYAMGKNSTNLTFAGQAGFILKLENGYRIGIDLYLSDCCNRYFGLKRLMPYVFNPAELDLDLLIATHAHYDHFDPDSIPIIMANNKTELVCACDCKEEADRLNLDSSRISYLKVDGIFENTDVKITAIPCDHGDEAPEAIGLLIEADSKRIYIAGDTCFRQDTLTLPELFNPDVFIMPINGAFGNLNETEGAQAAGIIQAKLTIPCHFWNFAEHFGRPYLFVEEMDEKYPNLKYNLMRVGETIAL